MDLKQKDKKILTYLYHHYRTPLTEVSKKCKVSRDQVEYTLNKYESNSIIRKYLTIFNYSLLGYNEFIIVWMNAPKNKEKIKKNLEEMKNVVSIGEISAEYDFFVNFVFKNKQEFEDTFYKLLQKNKIKDYDIFLTTYSNLYPQYCFKNIIHFCCMICFILKKLFTF